MVGQILKDGGILNAPNSKTRPSGGEGIATYRKLILNVSK
jgi:hypothetical protein